MSGQEIISSQSLEGLPMLALLVLMLPLISFLTCSIIHKKYANQAARLSTLILASAFIISAYTFSQVWGANAHHFKVEWFSIFGEQANRSFSFGLLIDNVTALMLLIVTFIATLVHLYSIEYMKGDDGFKRYFSFLGLFTFSMLGIVLVDNLLLIFVFWELVGLSSYLLIGFWYQKDSAVAASKKAFLVNRVGDLGFLVGLMILWWQFGTFDLIEIVSNLNDPEYLNSKFGALGVEGSGIDKMTWLTLAGLGLFCGVIGKSAQFPLQIWLPDAMEGPTPVSALIHAATMVAAGVFLLARVFVILSPGAMTVIALVGSITAFMGAIAALTQHDIKKVLAYSTISQLGYMVMGMGVGAYDAALFHLLTHAAFKACLFLGAGAIIHALHRAEHAQNIHFDAQDMRNMGGLLKKLPLTSITYFIATASLIGLPFFSGFLSKDAILTSAYANANSLGGVSVIIPILGLITVFLTALYMGRQIFLVFFGEFRLERHKEETSGIGKHIKENSWQVQLPLIILAMLSISFVYAWSPLDGAEGWAMSTLKNPERATFWAGFVSPVLTKEILHEYHFLISGVSVALGLIGLIAAYTVYKPGKTFEQTYFQAQDYRKGLLSISFNNWFLDGIYHFAFVTPILKISAILNFVERKVIDKAIDLFAVGNVVLANITGWIDRAIVDGLVNFAAYSAGMVGRFTKSIQGGKIQTYFIWAILGMLSLIIWLTL
ncbi:MAG: NADH-quinone oxidoreductase subunit L [Bacteroidota bacterium]